VRAFVYNGLPARVVFGAGALARLPEELDRLGAKRALVLSTPEQAASARQVASALGARCAGTYDKAAMHVPVEIAEDARRTARELGADCCVTVGGGSTTGLGKAIALTSAVPILAVPTTYAGSEMTPIYGITEGGAKKTGRDVRVLPKSVIYDPTLTLSLPPALSAASGMNAIATRSRRLSHEGNPVPLTAEEASALASALPAILQSRPFPSDASARFRRGGVRLRRHGAAPRLPCFGAASTSACRDALDRAPHAVRYNQDAAPDAMRRRRGIRDAAAAFSI
jgi:glycerol dehydrogenase-like iron-containing ADH family enzyme